MPCAKHQFSVIGCDACWNAMPPSEDIRSLPPRPGEKFGIERYRRGVSQSIPGRGYYEEDAPDNEEGA